MQHFLEHQLSQAHPIWWYGFQSTCLVTTTSPSVTLCRHPGAPLISYPLHLSFIQLAIETRDTVHSIVSLYWTSYQEEVDSRTLVNFERSCNVVLTTHILISSLPPVMYGTKTTAFGGGIMHALIYTCHVGIGGIHALQTKAAGCLLSSWPCVRSLLIKVYPVKDDPLWPCR